MRYIIAILAAIVLLYSVPVQAANPADLTACYLFGSGTFLKVAVENDPWFYASRQVAKNTSIGWYGCDDEASVTNELSIAQRIGSRFQTGYIANYKRECSDTTLGESLMFDYEANHFGIGMIASLEGEPIQFGFRYKGKVNLFLTLEERSKPFVGIGFKTKKGTNIDLAANNKAAYLRASKSYRDFTPELRTKFGDNGFVGFGIGYSIK
ncbi:TPA: hypothetical protein DD449_03925 [Candidatus Berkelbacteria bacterium]|uniref:Outer membrane protein beta-barrel domain-containing protein n=1 Tax=Berkelbacteria bacterium GW2011_GWE1_39_12 TaxID=1618337 RepID=A0A0G4B5I1_9BACT|nr:MAG: hypothetical protein UT28_C0001G0421 [Berkelbacteria bacterium GW2011_GWE1_39_12]HBO60805.1 hypothetical protein [Candidatus Berkelbacteria bacterium]